MRRICVMQDDLKDCGVSALLTIIRYYHGDISKEILREMTKTTVDGVSAFYLIKTAQELGFSTKALKGDIMLLTKDDFPFIAHTIINKSYQHFVVVYEITKDKIIIADPSKGIKKLTFSEWQEISTNKYLIFKPSKKIPKMTNELKFSDILLSIVNLYKPLLITVFLLSLIYTFFNVITSYNFKLMMDAIDLYNKENIKMIFIVLIVFGIIKNLADLFRGKIINYINNHLDRKMIIDVYTHIVSLPYLYYKNRTCGDIITRINDIANVKELLGKVFLTLFVDIILIVFVLIMLWQISIKLTVIAIILSIVYIVVIIIYNKIIHHHVKDSYEKSSLVNSYLVETISSIDTIKGLNIENMVCNKLDSKYNQFVNVNQKIGNILLNEEFFKESIYYIGVLTITFVGIGCIINNTLSVTLLITYLSLLSYYLEPIRNVVDLHFTFKKTIISFKRVMELYHIKSEELLITKKHLETNLKGDIVFENLTYSYNGIDNILNNVSFKIKAQKRVLICGSSGQGKSTLVKLLIKYMNDYDGNIYIDNRELRHYDLIDIRNKICYVSQNETLFTDSVYNNIVLNKDISYEEFLKVTKLVRVDEFIKKLPLQYDTLIEENGFNLSGGERQRLILARTLLKKADIYIFDEALNAIDVIKERLILRNIFRYLNGKTIIIISHRFNNEDLFDYKINMGDFYEC